MSWKAIVPLLVIVVLVVTFVAFRGGDTGAIDRSGEAISEPESEVLGDTLTELAVITAEEDAEIRAGADEEVAELDYESDLAEVENAAEI